MRVPRKVVSAICGAAMIAIGLNAAQAASSAEASQPAPAPGADPAVSALAHGLGITVDQARVTLAKQDEAHRVLAALPAPLRNDLAGRWFDATSGKLGVAVTSAAAARQARAAGAEPKLVARDAEELGGLHRSVGKLAGSGVPGLRSFGIDDRANIVQVSINPTVKSAVTTRFVQRLKALGSGVQVRYVDGRLVQQAGDVNPGDAWYPGSESPCSVGFAATDAQGGKHFLTAGHCTNDANQAAYGESGQQNKLGTSNVGGSRSINAREGDMGVVAVTEAGWNLSADVNTYGQPAVKVNGSAEALVGDAVCHSGKTSPYWECGKVLKVNQSIDYGNVVIDGLTVTDTCSQGGDSGGAWLRGDKAVGLHSGGEPTCGGAGKENSIFQPVNEALTKWGLTLFNIGDVPDNEAPTTPGNLRSAGATTTSVSLAWDASRDNVGVTAYEVYRGGSLAATVTAASATVTGLQPNTEYSFTVQAKDAAGNKSGAAGPLTVRTQGDGGGDDEAPTTPGNPRSTGATTTSIALAWDASVDNVGIAAYDVLRGSAVVATSATSTVSVTGLTPNTEYSFTVQARDAAGNKSKPSPAVTARTQADNGGGRTFSNGTDYPIRDFETAISPIRSTATGLAARPVTVRIDATHTCTEDLNIRVISPSGRSYWLQNYGGSACHPFESGKTFTFTPASTEQAAGTWTLRIGDNGYGDIGTLTGWAITV
ncbi:hypothetical protein E1263_09705 [Kribbella antibiotica]|uniref:Trypsin-like serine protease n=1 Tax=Kribbella antibiotica TaxID=190195 RepID=A0A4R4ZR88_9ACTN|nr:fibronectin type III domain-containing protein [Kribbella antibiotica]TDD60880.1 hypothetical protein E1263_09705 [Kribbella antibiotica]